MNLSLSRVAVGLVAVGEAVDWEVADGEVVDWEVADGEVAEEAADGEVAEEAADGEVEGAREGVCWRALGNPDWPSIGELRRLEAVWLFRLDGRPAVSDADDVDACKIIKIDIKICNIGKIRVQ